MRWFLRAPPCIDVRGGASSVTARPLNKRPSQTLYFPSPCGAAWSTTFPSSEPDDGWRSLRSMEDMLFTMTGGRRPWLWEASCLGRTFISHTVIQYAVLADHHMSLSANSPFRTRLFNSFGLLGASPTLPRPARVAHMHSYVRGNWSLSVGHGR